MLLLLISSSVIFPSSLRDTSVVFTQDTIIIMGEDTVYNSSVTFVPTSGNQYILIADNSCVFSTRGSNKYKYLGTPSDTIIIKNLTPGSFPFRGYLLMGSSDTVIMNYVLVESLSFGGAITIHGDYARLSHVLYKDDSSFLKIDFVRYFEMDSCQFTNIIYDTPQPLIASGLYIWSSSGIISNTSFSDIINGSGVYMDLGYSTSHRIVFQNVSISSCSNRNGAGITIIADSVPFQDTVVIAGSAFGGWFAGNSADTLGGGILIDGLPYVEIDTSYIGFNSAYHGGGIAAKGGSKVRVYGSIIWVNFADTLGGYGGGIYVLDSAQMIIDSSYIEFNTAGYGGGIYSSSTDSLFIENGSRIISNTAKQSSGGGIMVIRIPFVGIYDAVIRKNSTGYDGGGFSILWSNGLLRGTLVESNTAVHGGGGFIYGLGYNVNIDSSSFIANKADSNGSALWIKYSSDTINECSFVSDSAGFNGCIYLEHASSSILGSSFSENVAYRGTCIYLLKTTDSYIYGSSFMDNSGAYGVAVYADTDSVAVVDSCLISRNFSSLYGAITTFYSTTHISNSSFEHNSASYGGAYYNNYSTDTLINNVFYINHATNYGGGIRIWHGKAFIENCRLLFNTAYNGGGLALVGGVLDRAFLRHTLFLGNKAGSYGGGIYAYSGDLGGQYSTLISNFSSSGGAIRYEISISGGLSWSSGVDNATYGGNSNLVYITSGAGPFFMTFSNVFDNTVLLDTSVYNNSSYQADFGRCYWGGVDPSTIVYGDVDYSNAYSHIISNGISPTEVTAIDSLWNTNGDFDSPSSIDSIGYGDSLFIQMWGDSPSTSPDFSLIYVFASSNPSDTIVVGLGEFSEGEYRGLVIPTESSITMEEMERENTIHVSSSGDYIHIISMEDQTKEKIISYKLPPVGVERPAYTDWFRAGSLIDGRVIVNLSLSSSRDVEVKLYDMTGRMVEKIFSGKLSQGPHTLKGTLFHPSGVYFVKLTGKDSVLSRKIVILK